jgi:hypothetical protein
VGTGWKEAAVIAGGMAMSRVGNRSLKIRSEGIGNTGSGKTYSVKRGPKLQGKGLSGKGASGPEAKLTEIQNMIKEGEIKGNNIITPLDENTQVIFRNDTGVNAHPIRPHGYNEATNHYNIEIQVKNQAGKELSYNF